MSLSQFGSFFVEAASSLIRWARVEAARKSDHGHRHPTPASSDLGQLLHCSQVCLVTALGLQYITQQLCTLLWLFESRSFCALIWRLTRFNCWGFWPLVLLHLSKSSCKCEHLQVADYVFFFKDILCNGLEHMWIAGRKKVWLKANPRNHGICKTYKAFPGYNKIEDKHQILTQHAHNKNWRKWRIKLTTLHQQMLRLLRERPPTRICINSL